MATSQDIPQPSITEFSLEIAYVTFHSNLLGDNELKAHFFIKHTLTWLIPRSSHVCTHHLVWSEPRRPPCRAPVAPEPGWSPSATRRSVVDEESALPRWEGTSRVTCWSHGLPPAMVEWKEIKYCVLGNFCTWMRLNWARHSTNEMNVRQGWF